MKEEEEQEILRNGQLLRTENLKGLSREQAILLIGKITDQGKVIGVTNKASRNTPEGIYLITNNKGEFCKYHRVDDLSKSTLNQKEKAKR